MFAKALETPGAVAVKPAEYFPYQDSAWLHAMGSCSRPCRLRQRLTSPALPTERCLHLHSCQPITSLRKADFPPSLPIPERSAEAALALMSLLTAHPLFIYLIISFQSPRNRFPLPWDSHKQHAFPVLTKVLLRPWVRASTAVRKPKVQTLFQPPALVLPDTL